MAEVSDDAAPSPPRWTLRRAVPLVLTAIVVLAAIALFVSRVREYWFLSDDAYISFRYSRNLVDGLGLVWNEGEAVEGYTNFLWVMLMAGVLAFGGAPEVASNVLGVASGSLLLVGITVFGIRRYGARDPFVWLPAVTLTASHSFAAWCTSGLETMFFTALAFAGCAAFLREREREREAQRRVPVAPVLFALATLTRPEGAIFMFVAGLAYLVDVVRERRTVKSLVLWCAPYVAIVGLHVAWRYWYYGAPLPNTFYAKVPGSWWEQGVRYVELFEKHYAYTAFLPLLLLSLVRGDFASRFFLALLVVYMTYVLYVGGDRFEFRFLVVVLPYLYLSFAHGLRGVAAAGSKIDHFARPMMGVALAGAAILVGSTYRAAEVVVPREERHKIAKLSGIKKYAENRAEQGRFLRELIDAGELPGNVVLGLGGAGAVPYYTMWPTVDRRGLNDATIARQPFEDRGRVGHERDASWEYLEERKVAVFDITNRLLYDNPKMRNRQFQHDGRKVRLRGVKLRDRYLFFATFVSDEELAETFQGHEIIVGR